MKVTPDSIPSYRRQKRPQAVDLAFVRLHGKRHYLGAYGSPESRQEYNRLIAEYLVNAGQEPVAPNEITVVEVAQRYLAWVEGYYRKNGEPTSEVANITLALRPLTALYGRSVAAEFGPKSLKAVREEWIRQGCCRKYINRHVGRIVRMFKWAVAEELIPAHVHHGLRAVSGLKFGRSAATESAPVKPAPLDLVEAVKNVVSRQVAAMIDLQLLTGARPGEIVIMRGIDIDTSGPVWVYKPSSHKTEHHGHDRWIPLGPKAKAIVEPFLASRPLHAYLFSPLEAEAERYAELHAKRATPLACGSRPKGKGKAGRFATRALGDHYDRTSYARAIARGCQVAFPLPAELNRRWVPQREGGRRWETVAEWHARLGDDKWQAMKTWRREHHWHPHQLRHNFATDVRKVHGLEIAQILLGHAKADVTQVYAERDLNRAIDVAAKIG